MKQNTSQLWDALWEQRVSADEDLYTLKKEEHSIRWQRIHRIVLNHFGAFDGLNVIEIGAGAGTNAALMAKHGAAVTLLDYSPGALKRSKEFFERNGLSAAFVDANALSLPEHMLSQYDIAMSFGLTEHFKGSERININKAHFDMIKKGGIVFISVPNKYNPPYRIYKLFAEAAQVWSVGEEYPYSRREFRNICSEIGIDEYTFFGDSLLWSFNFINPAILLQKVMRKFGGSQRFNNKAPHITMERGTFLDAYLSYALVLCGRKK